MLTNLLMRYVSFSASWLRVQVRGGFINDSDIPANLVALQSSACLPVAPCADDDKDAEEEKDVTVRLMKEEAGRLKSVAFVSPSVRLFPPYFFQFFFLFFFSMHFYFSSVCQLIYYYL